MTTQKRITFPVLPLIDTTTDNMKSLHPILRNLFVLKAICEATDVTHFHLDSFVSDPKAYERSEEDTNLCGTLFCLAGTAALYDHFQDQGMFIHLVSNYLSQTKIGMEVESNHCFSSKFDELFGRYAMERLFQSFGDGSEDFYIMADLDISKEFNRDDNESHKKLALARIEYAIEDFDPANC